MASVLLGAHEVPLNGAITLREWAQEWRSFTVHLKPKTVVGYDSLLRNQLLPAFGDTALDDIDGLAVRRWVAGLVGSGLSASRTNQAFRLLGQLIRLAVECGLIERDQCQGVKLPRVPTHEASFLTPSEIERLAAEVAARYRPLVHVLAYGGLRWGEAAALRRGRMDRDRARLTVAESLAEVNGRLVFGSTKTDVVRTVSLPAFLVAELEMHLVGVAGDESALVFTSPQGRPLRLPNFRRRVWWPALERAGLPRSIRIHDLRHSCATMLIANGVHPKAIQRHLGHANIDIMMNRYGHLLPEQFEAIGASLDAIHGSALST
jgi:integrase